MKVIRLRDGKERSLLRRHPWVFEGSIDKGGGDSGETVRVQSHDGRELKLEDLMWVDREGDRQSIKTAAE